MAAQTAVETRADRFLRLILAEVDGLPDTATRWCEWLDWQQADFALEWGHLMVDYLAELTEQYQSGAMSEPQRAQYRELLLRLRSALPVIERLRLQVPDASLENTADATPR